MKNRYLVILGLALFPSQFFGLTIEEVLVHTYQENSTISAAREELKALDETFYQAMSGWLPTVAANFSRGGGSGKTNISDDWVSGVVDKKSISLNQPIFNGGATIAAMKKAVNDVDAGKASLNNVEQDTLFLAVSSYMQVIKKQESLKITENNVAVLGQHLNFTETKQRLGAATRTDVSQAKARYSNAISEKTIASGEVEKEKSNFRKITGLEPENLVDPQANDKLTLPTLLDEAIEKAMERNPAIIAANKAYDAAYQSRNIAYSNLLPDASFIYEYAKSKSPSISFANKSTSQSYLFNVSVPLYQAGSEYSSIRQAGNNVNKLQSLREVAKNDVVDAVISAWKTKDVANSTIRSATDAVEADTDALDGVIKENKVGARTSLDVLDAEQELFNAKLSLVSAKINYFISKYQIKALVGELTPENIGLNIKNYDPDYHFDRTKFKIIGF